MVGSEPEGERALEPHRLGVLAVQPLVIDPQRGKRFCAQLELVLAAAEGASAPAFLEQLQQLRKRLSGGGVVALEHLMHDDPKPLVLRLLGRDTQDSSELVPQWTTAVGLDIRGRQRQADPLARQKGPQRGGFARSDRARSGTVLVISSAIVSADLRTVGQQRLVERRGL